jgi:transcriptional regulator with XRE-family HTH domain
MSPDDAPKPTRKPRTYISIELSAQFGQALRDARLRAGLTQTDVAERAQVSQSYVSRTELGSQKLTVERMSLLAGIVGLQVVANLVGLDEAEFGSAAGPRQGCRV